MQRPLFWDELQPPPNEPRFVPPRASDWRGVMGAALIRAGLRLQRDSRPARFVELPGGRA